MVTRNEFGCIIDAVVLGERSSAPSVDVCGWDVDGAEWLRLGAKWDVDGVALLRKLRVLSETELQTLRERVCGFGDKMNHCAVAVCL